MKAVILDSIRSMQNVGAIMRNADGAGFDTVYMCGFTPCPPRSDISKTALGAEKTVFWEYYQDIFDLLEKLQSQHVRLFCLEVLDGAYDFRDIQYREDEDIAIILGNEVNGVDPRIAEKCSDLVYIPMKGQKTSLNVSVAAGIIMYRFVD